MKHLTAEFKGENRTTIKVYKDDGGWYQLVCTDFDGYGGDTTVEINLSTETLRAIYGFLQQVVGGNASNGIVPLPSERM